MLVKIVITPKPEILDPQGKAVAGALKDLGYDEVSDVKVGKYIILKLSPSPGLKLEERVDEMCRRLLANINVESYTVEILEG
ncbi:MAG: phosphoribosylformylglycinamidine synthase subunit PurS [bacterium]|nr:phosphoribosylformylglycinamidine synthase subunit PurS [bacterium]